jgi:hypothetical protein
MAERDAVSPVLREALRGWLHAAFEVLAGRDVPGIRDVVITLQEGALQGADVVVPDYFMFALRNNEALSDLAETEAVLEIVRADPELRAVLLADRSGAPRQLEAEKSWLVIERLVPFAAAVLDRDPHLDRTDMAAVDAVFAQAYDLFEEAIFRFEAIPVTWLVQFANLGLEVDDFELELGIRVRRPTEQERSLAFQVRFGSLLGQPSRSSAMFANPARAMDIPDPGEIPDVFLEFTDHRHLPRNRLSAAGTFRLAERMQTALRLVNGNDVGIHSIWYIDDNPFDRFQMPRRMWPDPLASDRSGSQYVVTPEIKHQLREVWPRLATEPTERVLSLALRRLNDSYHRARPEDRLIDYWIALEALFLRVRESELKFRASLLAARYIGVDQNERLDLRDEVGDSYNLRSSVVHGARLPPDDEVRQVTERTGDLLRRVLRRCLADEGPPNIDQLFRELLA